MNFKRSIFTIILISIFSIFIIAQNVAYATQVSPTMYLGLKTLMTDDWGYAMGGNTTSSSGGSTRDQAKIWNLVEYNSETATSYTNTRDIFCLREGEGFIDPSTGESSTTIKKPYTEYYNMKTARSTILSQVYNWNKTIDGTIDQYNAILSILDLFYINAGTSTKSSSSAYRESLLKNAGIASAKLTDADIKAVEQAALWYFTNYGENNVLYDQTGSPNWLYYTQDGNTYTFLGDYDKTPAGSGSGQARLNQANLLYNYLITTAKANASKYSNTSLPDIAPVKVNTTKLEYKTSTKSHDFYVVGPINISKQDSSNTLDSIDLAVKYDDTEIASSNYVLVNNSEESYDTKNVKELLDQQDDGEFDIYLRLLKSDISDINKLSVGIKTNYSNTTSNLYTNPTDISGTQPVVIPEKDEDSTTVTLTTEEKVNKTFDLALRKYITKVGSTVLANSGKSRVPEITTSTLEASGTTKTTATYKHRKDPVSVKNGDTVTYEIAIYNEGEKLGRPTKVVDQLPTGLKFKSVDSGNFEKESYSEADNTLYLKRKSSNTDDLSPHYERHSKSYWSSTI